VNVDSPKPDAALLRKYRIRVAIFLVGVVIVLALLGVAYKGINTIYVLDVVESERDQWQRSSEVISSLKLKTGDIVADVGSGAGYFSLKLSRAVGRSGAVLAVDTHRLPLAFLWIRAFSTGLHNIRVCVGESSDPHLPVGAVDAVLIANTYHEFRAPESMIDHAYRSLRLGGRLAVLDRSQGADDPRQSADHHHGIAAAIVDAQLQRQGFRILEREDGFIERAGEQWWLLVAQR
jgi:ubiquinone/menaquinone biosynthesis C-methylase UbiE